MTPDSAGTCRRTPREWSAYYQNGSADDGVVGSELNEPFAELLTWEAQVALTQGQTDIEPSPSSTYYRMRTVPASQHAMERSWSRLYAERPRGFLPIDRKNLRPQGGRGSKIEHMVGVRGFKLNSQLAEFLRKHSAELQQPTSVSSPQSIYRRYRHWRVRDRLSPQDIRDLVRAFKAGTPKHDLAERYDINLGSLKKLLREEGVTRKSWRDIQP